MLMVSFFAIHVMGQTLYYTTTKKFKELGYTYQCDTHGVCHFI